MLRLLVFLALLAAPTFAPPAFAPPAFAQDSAQNGSERPGAITVSARGTATAAPDLATLSFAVRREADTAREALDATSAAMAQVLAALKEMGIAERDLRTTDLSLQPRIVYPNPNRPRSDDGDPDEEGPRVTGYIASNGLSVRVRDITKVGAVLDRAVDLGVNTGGGVSFGNADPSVPEQQARTDAVRRAVAKARTLAEAAGVSLGPLVAIREGGRIARPRPQVFEARAARSDAVPIAAGENEYSVSVTMEWRIGG